jgi:hypothetical protein
MARCESCFEPVASGAVCAACAARTRSDIALPLGAQLQHGRYLIGRTLGDPGGFGVTYLGWDTSLERRVAIKEYFPKHLVTRAPGHTDPTPTGGSASDDYTAGLQGFLDEARRLARLDHPDIVKVHDYCEAFGTGYLVMSYYEGHDLRTHVERAGGTLDWQEAVSIMLPLLDGLAEVHRAGLIHRDIKPANVYLATLPDGRLRPILIDFGAARWATTTHELTSILTEGYAPLEQYPGCGPQGTYTDVYAAAATLYAVVSGRVPATAPSRLTHAYVAHLSDQVPGVPRRVGDAVEQALAIQAEDRPQSAEEFSRGLRAAAGVVTSRLIAPAPGGRGVPAAAGAPPAARTAPTVPPTVADASTPTEVMPRPAALRPRGGLIGYGVALAAVIVAVAMYVVNQPRTTPSGDAQARAPSTAGDSAANLEPRADGYLRDARAALAKAEYASAMASAGALHDLSLRPDAPTASRASWSAGAESIAAEIGSACATDLELNRRRGVAMPPCPARPW